MEHPASDDDDDDNDDDLDDFDEVLSVQDIANTHGILMFQTWIFFSPPENDSFRKNFCFTADVLFFSTREISEMRGRTGAKFCTMVSTRPNFIIPSKILGGAPQKNFGGEKHAKFGPISDDFQVRRRISPKGMKIFKIGFLFRLPRFLLR